LATRQPGLRLRGTLVQDNEPEHHLGTPGTNDPIVGMTRSAVIGGSPVGCRQANHLAATPAPWLGDYPEPFERYYLYYINP